MSKVVTSLIDNCIDKVSNDKIIKTKVEKDIIAPIISKSYTKVKPYLFILLYLYGLIVLLLIIIILLLLFNKHK